MEPRNIAKEFQYFEDDLQSIKIASVFVYHFDNFSIGIQNIYWCNIYNLKPCGIPMTN